MATKTKSPSKAKKTEGCTSIDGVDVRLKQMGQKADRRAKLQAEMDEAGRKAVAPFLKKINKLTAEIVEMDAQAVTYAQAHRDELLNNVSGKTVKLPHGEIQFRAGSTSVVLTMDDDLVIGALMDSGYKDAVRVKATVDKTYIKAHPEIANTVKGIEVETGPETVVLKPRAVC